MGHQLVRKVEFYVLMAGLTFWSWSLHLKLSEAKSAVKLDLDVMFAHLTELTEAKL